MQTSNLSLVSIYLTQSTLELVMKLEWEFSQDTTYTESVVQELLKKFIALIPSKHEGIHVFVKHPPLPRNYRGNNLNDCKNVTYFTMGIPNPLEHIYRYS